MSRVHLLNPESTAGLGESFFDGESGLPETITATEYHRDVALEPLARMLAEAVRLFEPKPVDSDAWLAPRLHATLRLTPREAADKRLWWHLAAVDFADYVRWRWRSNKGTVAAGRFLGGDVNQALSRLWWGAELTRNGSSYAATAGAFKFQDIPNTWFRLHVFHHRPAVLAALRVIGELKGGELPSGEYAKRTDKINRLSTAVNILAVTTALDVLVPWAGSDPDALKEWTTTAPDPERYLAEEPEGPAARPVSEEQIERAEAFIRDAAENAGLFHDESGDGEEE